MRMIEQLVTIPCLLVAAGAALAASPAGGDSLDPEGLSRLAPGEALVVGEVHGSKETPAAFAKLVDHMLTRTKLVSVGLEMPTSAGAAGCGAWRQLIARRILDAQVAGRAQQRSDEADGVPAEEASRRRQGPADLSG
jgi:hypothetical protein